MFYRTSEKYLKVDATPKRKAKKNLVHAQDCLFLLEIFFHWGTKTVFSQFSVTNFYEILKKSAIFKYFAQ